MYRLNWHIRVGKYRLCVLKDVHIVSSVLNLMDTATIEVPGRYMNAWQRVEDKIKVGDEVVIKLGYDDTVDVAFEGYLSRISKDNDSLVFECEDSLFLLKKTVQDKEYKQISLKNLLKDLLKQVDDKLLIDCDYAYTMNKFVVFKSTALDVLKKIQEEVKANIWFAGKTLHVHPVYTERPVEESVLYDTNINVQSKELKYIDASDKKVKIDVVFTNSDGKVKKKSFGTSGGEVITKHISGESESSMRVAAENEYNLWNYSGFEGSFTGWYLPVVNSGGVVRLRDENRHEGKYYVTGVEIEFGQNGGKRKVSLGRKLG